MLIKISSEAMEQLTETERRVIVFINSHADKFSKMSIGDVADEIFSSPATVSRTIKKMRLGRFCGASLSTCKSSRVPCRYNRSQ